MTLSFLRKLSILSLFLLSPSVFAQTQNPEFLRLWNQYAQSTAPDTLQDGCKPTLISAEAGIPFKGTVILHHGFTACSQQYLEWSKRLSHEGFDVALTVLPGHGKKWMGKNLSKNDLTTMPTHSTWKKAYASFSKQMNEMMDSAAGLHVIGGLSVGAVVAANSALMSPKTYDRVLLLSPFFQMTGLLKRDLMKALGATPIVRNSRLSWGKACEVTERGGGRAGYCQFTIDDIASDQAFGKAVMKLASTVPSLPRFQIVAVEGDPVASPSAIASFSQTLNERFGDQFAIAHIREGANHSLLSRFDAPTEDKWWLNPLLDQITSYVSDGTAVSTDSF